MFQIDLLPMGPLLKISFFMFFAPETSPYSETKNRWNFSLAQQLPVSPTMKI